MVIPVGVSIACVAGLAGMVNEQPSSNPLGLVVVFQYSWDVLIIPVYPEKTLFCKSVPVVSSCPHPEYVLPVHTCAEPPVKIPWSNPVITVFLTSKASILASLISIDPEVGHVHTQLSKFRSVTPVVLPTALNL